MSFSSQHYERDIFLHPLIKDEKKMTPVKMRLDNASTIYPAALTKRYASIFRMSVTLTETINLNILQQALDTTVKRIPLFFCQSVDSERAR